MKNRSMAVWLNGLAAGAIGAAITALWSLLLETARGLPFYAPTVLGTVFFLGLSPDGSIEPAQFSLELLLAYLCFHALAFVVLGEIAAFVLLADKNPNLWLSVLLLFAALHFGFVATAFVFAKLLFDGVAWLTVVAGNLLAAAGMAGYLQLRHPKWQRYRPSPPQPADHLSGTD
ncbi:MAG TPA: hypothetical protein VNN77_02055 [candidate division Zixibacteria bacterium]|nr:hypothetical protein [candidate division Zixibacteria bacterium]